MKPQTTAPMTLLCLAFGLLTFFGSNTQTVHAQQVQVTAADPSAAAQATVNLNVKVTGKGFKNGAKAKFLVTATTDPGGVQVNSTTFVSSTELRANIDVAETAIIANFDIEVLNSDGRGGKGTELFKVIAKVSNGGGSGCPPLMPGATGDTTCYASWPGCLDTSFGINGLVTTDPSGPAYGNDGGKALLVQNDGKIIAAGETNRTAQGTGLDFVAVRYNTDGSLDTSFGDPDPLNPGLRLGYVITSITANNDYQQAALLQPDGKIIVGGTPSPGEMAVARYNTDGTLDTTFGIGGKVVVNFGSHSFLRQLAIQSDGKLILAGEALTPAQFGLARLNSNGSLDSSFGTGGKLTVNPSSAKRGYGPGWSVAIQRVPAVTGEERIVVAGWSKESTGDNTAWTIMRLKPNGALDTTFGTSGRVKTAFFGFADQARRIGIDSQNGIVAAGIVRTGSDNCGSYIIDYGLARYTQNGILDVNFSGGKQTVDIYGGSDNLYGLVIQPNGKILIVGSAASSDGSVTDFGMIRFNTDGTRDSTFGIMGNGIVTSNFYGFGDYGYAVGVQPADGKIIMVGSVYFAGGGSTSAIGVARFWP